MRLLNKEKKEKKAAKAAEEESHPWEDGVHSDTCEPWCNRFELLKGSAVCSACTCVPDTGDPKDTGMPCSLMSPRPPNSPPLPPVAPSNNTAGSTGHCTRLW